LYSLGTNYKYSFFLHHAAVQSVSVTPRIVGINELENTSSVFWFATQCSMHFHILKPRVHLNVGRRLASSSASKARHVLPIDPSSLPRGFVATGVHCGVKKNASMPDLGLVLSTAPASQTSSAACFTRNAFKAAPVTVSADVLEKSSGRARAIVVNSGCANAVTGKQGLSDAWAMSRATDTLLDDGDTGTLVMSTGVIGQNLPITRILTGIQSAASTLGSSPEHWDRVARAFMTTDTFPKIRAGTFDLGGPSPVRILGIDKGAGMIHPSMGPAPAMLPLHATLLGLFATDARVSPRSLQNALTYAVDRSFNSISVDGDMSTNDTIVALANGAAGGVEVDEHKTPKEYELFKTQLTNFAIELAQLVVRDGEGATKFVTISVHVRQGAQLTVRLVTHFTGGRVVRGRASCRLHDLYLCVGQNSPFRGGR
jgi:glutamate N-acetyltransferase / amino-acid N-acetyltransferase